MLFILNEVKNPFFLIYDVLGVEVKYSMDSRLRGNDSVFAEGNSTARHFLAAAGCLFCACGGCGAEVC